MVETILITLLIVAISLVLLGVKSIFTKGGKFPNGHVSGNKAFASERNRMRTVARSRSTKEAAFFSINELEKALNDSMN